MTFASPILLVCLLPWMAVVVYLFRGMGQRAVVPFLKLWPRPVAIAIRSGFRPPPTWILLAYTASLLAILAAAGPDWMIAAPVVSDVSIVIDRGITMSGVARYDELIAQCQRFLGPHTAGAAITLIPVPGSSVVVTDGSWAAVAAALSPTAIDTHLQLQSAVTSQLAEARGPVVVLSDQPIDRSSARVIQIAPERGLDNIGIEFLAARASPHPQVMVRLRNHSATKTVQLRVQSGRNVADRIVHFTGNSAAEFIDMPALEDSVSAAISSSDDIPADNAAWLTRERSGVTLDVTGGVPNDVRRMAEVFARHRPAGRHVLISDMPLPNDQPGVQIVTGNGSGEPLIPVTTIDNQLVSGVTVWPGPAGDLKPPAGFRPVVERAGVPLVAQRESSPRQIWINLNLATWGRTTDFVIFFSDVFESFRSGSGSDFVSSTPVLLGPEWKRVDGRPAPANVPLGLWPGLYRSEDGRLLAVDAPAPQITSLSDQASSPLKISNAVRKGFPLAAVLCCGALVCLLIGMARWPRTVHWQQSPRGRGG
jgi:hypothetical protein